MAIAAGFTAPILFTFMRHLLQGAGRQAFWSLLLLVLLTGGAALSVTYLALMFPNLNAVEWTRKITGNFLGTLLCIWWVAVFGAFAAVTLRQFGDLVNTLFLIRTPIEVTMFLLLFGAMYINWHGLETVVRFIGLVFPIMAVLLLIVLVATLIKADELAAMLPPPDFDLSSVLQGSWSALYAVTGLETVAGLAEFVKSPRRPYRTVALAVGVNSVLLVIAFLTTVGVWGIEPAAQLEFPGVATLRVLRLPGMLVERPGSFIALSWTVLMLCYMCLRVWMVPVGIAQIFGLGLRQYRYFVFPFALMIFFLARWPTSHVQLEYYLRAIVGPAGALSIFVSPIVLIAVAKLRGMGRGA